MAWEEVDPPGDVLLMARCTRCSRVAGKYWEEGQWQDQRHRPGWCDCTPWPVLPSGEELAKLVERARRRPPARMFGDARLKIFVGGPTV
jgi:hypothetical protein